MLNREQVEDSANSKCTCEDCFRRKALATTLTAAIELLERQDKAYGKCLNASDWYTEHYPLVEDIESFLRNYHSTTAASNANKGDEV